jgi:hypothetical protein
VVSDEADSPDRSLGKGIIKADPGAQSERMKETLQTRDQ